MRRVELTVRGCRAWLKSVDESWRGLDAVLPVENVLDRRGELELTSVVQAGEEVEGRGGDGEVLALLYLKPGNGTGFLPFHYEVWYDCERLFQGMLEGERDWCFRKVLYDVPIGWVWTKDSIRQVIRERVLPGIEQALEALKRWELADEEGVIRFEIDWVERDGYRYPRLRPGFACCRRAWALRMTGERFAQHLRSAEHAMARQ